MGHLGKSYVVSSACSASVATVTTTLVHALPPTAGRSSVVRVESR